MASSRKKPLPELIGPEDDWTGITDPQARRKAQNRINQRVRRRRQAPQKWTPLRSRIDDIALGHQATMLPAVKSLPPKRSPITALNSYPFPLPRKRRGSPSFLRAGDDDTTSAAFPLSSDHLIPLIHFNVFRAMLTNMFTLSLADAFYADPDTVEWLHVSPADYPGPLPPALEPTVLQKCTPHPPWCDLFPLAGFRDAMIRAQDTFPDCEYAIDVLGAVSEPYHYPETEEEDKAKGYTGGKGLIVWGEPWRIESWEVEEGFVRKWGWLLRDGCKALLHSTNHWRRERGEEPLRWEEWNLSVD